MAEQLANFSLLCLTGMRKRKMIISTSLAIATDQSTGESCSLAKHALDERSLVLYQSLCDAAFAVDLTCKSQCMRIG